MKHCLNCALPTICTEVPTGNEQPNAYSSDQERPNVESEPRATQCCPICKEQLLWNSSRGLGAFGVRSRHVCFNIKAYRHVHDLLRYLNQERFLHACSINVSPFLACSAFSFRLRPVLSVLAISSQVLMSYCHRVHGFSCQRRPFVQTGRCHAGCLDWWLSLETCVCR